MANIYLVLWEKPVTMLFNLEQDAEDINQERRVTESQEVLLLVGWTHGSHVHWSRINWKGCPIFIILMIHACNWCKWAIQKMAHIWLKGLSPSIQGICGHLLMVVNQRQGFHILGPEVLWPWISFKTGKYHTCWKPKICVICG